MGKISDRSVGILRQNTGETRRTQGAQASCLCGQRRIGLPALDEAGETPTFPTAENGRGTQLTEATKTPSIASPFPFPAATGCADIGVQFRAPLY
jgi:hypothetical protein